VRDIVYLVGRILFGLIFIQYGYNHLAKTEGSAMAGAGLILTAFGFVDSYTLTDGVFTP
jgi:uncharacterized membrane protein YphA (DoxX/SURF4 family)